MPRPFPPVKPPPLPAQRGETYPRLVELMRRLRADDGCPWDREQTIASLRDYVLEEAAEVVDAIDGGDRDELRDELGDLLFQVVFLGELAAKEGAFGHDDVVASIVAKLVRRHPHVFGDEAQLAAGHVPARWEQIKAEERAAKGLGPRGALDGVPRSLPALTRGRKVGRAAAKQGFDWPDATGPRAKVDEELAELDEALASGDPARAEEELGDLLFAVTNLARHHDLDPERALHGTIRRFGGRFASMEEEARARGETLAERDIADLEARWERAKRREG